MPGNVGPVADEREGLLRYLDQQHDALVAAAYGLSDEQARLVPSRSALSIGGILRHVASTERGWIDTMLQRPAAGGSEAAYHDSFAFGPGDSLAEVVADLRKAGEETAAAVAGIRDLGQAVPVPKGVPWFPADVEAWSVRWVLLHLIEEAARHAGHADIVREHIDGATSYELLAGLEGWPETEWLTPWKPPVSDPAR